MATIGTLAVNIVARTDKFIRGVNKVRGSTSTLQKHLLGVGTAAVTMGGAMTAAMIRTSESINRAMTKSLAIMGDVSDKMRGDMVTAANKVAKATEASTAQAAESYFFLASAGLSAEQSLKAMPVVARFAQAGNFDLAQATDLATDAQSALGMASKDTQTTIANLTRVTDVLIKANTLANASALQFSEALTNGAGSALKLVGKEIEEGVAVLAAYADQGIKGAEAGTAFGIIMRDLQTRAIQNKSAFAAAGVSVFDAAGEMQNMADIVADLEGLLAGLSDEQKKFTLLQLGFSDKSVKYLQTLIGTSDKIKEYEENLKNAGGTASDVAAKSMTDLQRATEQMAASWDKLSLSVGGAGERLGVFKGLAEGMEGMGILLDNATGNGTDGPKKDALDLMTSGRGNPLSGARNAYGWLFDKLGLMPNEVGPADPGWSARAAEAAAKTPTPEAADAQKMSSLFADAFADGLAKATGAGRRGMLRVDNALSGIDAARQGANSAALQRGLGQLTFGMMGSTPDSSSAEFKAAQAQKVAALEEQLRKAEQTVGGGSQVNEAMREGSRAAEKALADDKEKRRLAKLQEQQTEHLAAIRAALEKAKSGAVATYSAEGV